ncbi:Restriction endonuclease [Aquiflexum balticum DSM 16537]|uniref:Restriction endonuclease n=1 Tax=Aquiflexum balticum DSM 16537 TaxID=758820 RepID=A0A1W2H0M3_9BACT|nr:restriction endonuclease [Aquiflexum balticum]SMD42421.1 Restriction endonuclease [Aquiflexum balticum DSM 16537]
MKSDNDIIQFAKKLCEIYNLDLEKSSENYFKINTDNASGISIIIEIDKANKLSFYFLQRTYDVFYHGDRTDAHVVLSLMFSSFIRLSGLPVSFSLFDIPHVVEDEIWGRYIMPVQIPSFFGISNEEQLRQRIHEIIALVVIWRQKFWEFAGCPCNNCMEKEGIDNNRDYEIQSRKFESIEKIYGKSSHLNYGGRKRPNWNYVYDFENEVTIIESEELSGYMQAIFNNKKFPENIIKGINGDLVIDKEINNFIHNDSRKEFEELIEALNGNKALNYPIIPFENMLIAVSNPYIIALGRLSGVSEFKSERELLRYRHNKEAEILFPIPSFLWIEKVCPDQFENLIKALLEREPNVKTVRRPAPINQGDKGRDLLIEWNVIDETIVSEVHPPSKIIKIVGQCKTSTNTIGKNKVIDIRDTVETHNSSGYFLAVNTQISSPLTEKLESLKNNGIWTSWWNREDIELRLSKNQDLIPNFPNVVKVKHKVKFVDKE